MDKNEVATKQAAGDGNLIKITMDGGHVLEVVDPNTERMFIEPKPHHGTNIALLLSRCVVPIQMNVFAIPKKLLDRIGEEATTAEMMLPFEMVGIRAEIAALKDELAGVVATMAGKDAAAMFVFEAVKDSGNIARNYLVSVLNLCNSVAEFQQRYASQDAFYQSQTLGAETIEPDTDSLLVPVQNHILDMNKMSAGWGGYRIMALLKTINQIAKLLDNSQIKTLFGAADALAMLNKLEFRVQPSQMAFSKNLCLLSEMVGGIGETKKVDKQIAGKLITLCRNIQSYTGTE